MGKVLLMQRTILERVEMADSVERLATAATLMSRTWERSTD